MAPFLSDGTITALQAKFFLPLKSSHRTQLLKSFTEALTNFRTLTRYIVALPFDPTPTVVARKGRGEQEKLNDWHAELKKIASGQGRLVEVEWWLATELRDRLLALPNAEGRILYWFGSGVLSRKAIVSRIKTARDIAGPRYSPVLKVGTPADGFIAASGALPRWFESLAAHRTSLVNARRRWGYPSSVGTN
jgi:hypothetical protein